MKNLEKELNAVLVILGKVLKHGYHFFDNDRGGHLLHKLGHVGGGLPAHHGGLIVDELAKLLSKK